MCSSRVDSSPVLDLGAAALKPLFRMSLLKGSTPSVLLHIRRGAPVNGRDDRDLTPLMLAASAGRHDISIDPGKDRALAVELASGAFAPPYCDGWESEEAMEAAPDDGGVRDGVRADQMGVSEVGRSYEPEWLVSSDDILVQTVHGVLRPWEGSARPSPMEDE